MLRPPPPPPRLASLLLLLVLAIASAHALAAAVADDPEVGTLAGDGLHGGAVSESPAFNWRRRSSRRRVSPPVAAAPVDSTAQPAADAVDSQALTPPTTDRPSREWGRATRRKSRNRISKYVPVSRRPQHNYALRGNYEPSTTTEPELTSFLSFSSNTESILAQATAEDYDHTSNHKTSETAEPVAGRNRANEKHKFSEVFNNRRTESPLPVDPSVEDGQAHVAKTTQRGSLSSGVTVSGFDSRRTVPRAAGTRSLFGRRSKFQSAYRSRSTSQFHITTDVPLTQTEQLDGHTRATREYDVLETTTPQVDTRTPRRRLVSRRRWSIDTGTETTVSPRDDEGDQRPVVRVHNRRRLPTVDSTTDSAVSTKETRDSLRKARLYKRRRTISPSDATTESIDTGTETTVSPRDDDGDQSPVVGVLKGKRLPTIDTTTDSAVSTTEARGSIRKTKLHTRRRPISTSVVKAEPSLLEQDASANQRGYRRVRPSSPQQESSSQQDSTTFRKTYQSSIQRTSKSEETVVGGRRKPGGRVRVRGRRPLLSHPGPDVEPSVKAVAGDGHGTVLTTPTVILPETASEVPEPQVTPSTSTTTEATTSRRGLLRSRRPFSGFRRAVRPSITPSIQARPVSHTTTSSVLEESSTPISLTNHTPADLDEQTTAASTNPATTSASNLSSTQVTGDTISENEGGLSKFSPKFGGEKGRLPGRRVNIGSKYSKDQRKTTPATNALGLTSGRIKSSTQNTTGEKPTGNVPGRLVKSRTLNSLRNRKPTSLLRRNKLSSVTEVPTAANQSLVENTIDDENLATPDGESATLPTTSVVDSYITTEAPASSTIKTRDRLKKTKIPLIPRKPGVPPRVPVLKKIPAITTEDKTNETSTVPVTGTRLKGRKPTGLDRLLKMRRPLPVLLRKSQDNLTSPSPQIVETSNNSETSSPASTLPIQADVTPGQTTAEGFETTTAAVATSSLQTNTDDSASNNIRKLPKGFKPPRFRPTIGEARRNRIKDTPGQGVRDRPRFTPSSSLKKGDRVNISAGNGTQSTAPLKIGRFNNRKPFSGLKTSLLKSTGRLNKKPAESDDEDTEIPTVSVKETTEAYSSTQKVEDNVIQNSVSDSSAKVDDEVQEMISNRPIGTTEETVTFQAKSTTLGDGAEETLDALVNPSLSPLEESGSTTRKTFAFTSARGRGSEKNSKLMGLQKLYTMFLQKSTTVKFNTETEHSTPGMPTELATDWLDGHPPDNLDTISQTEISVMESDDLKTTHTTGDYTLATVMETTVVPVVPEENIIPSNISENYGYTLLPLSTTTDFTTSSTTEKSESEDSPTIATKTFQAETETTFPETTTVSGGILELKGSDSPNNANTAMTCLNTSGELLKTNERSPRAQPQNDYIVLCGNNASAETTESSVSVTERPDEVLNTLESSTEIQDQSTTMVYEESATVTDPSSTIQIATQSVESTVSKLRTEPSTESTEGSVPESGTPFVSLTDIMLHNLTEAIIQLTNEIDSVYTDINVTSEFTSATTRENTTDLPKTTEEATQPSLDLNTFITPDVEYSLLTTVLIEKGAVSPETVTQQFNTTSETTTHANTEKPGTTIRITVQNPHIGVVKETEFSIATAAVPEETTVSSTDAVNAETVPQEFNTTVQSTTNASTEDPRTTTENTAENIYSIVVNEIEPSAATIAVPEETTMPSGLGLDQSITSTERHKVFAQSVQTDKTLVTTEVPDLRTGITPEWVTEFYESVVTQTEGPDSKTTEGNLAIENSLPTTEENRSNTGTFMDESLIGISDDRSESVSSFSGRSTRTVTIVDEFRSSGTTIAPETSTKALNAEEPRDNSGYTTLSTTDNLVTYDNDVSNVMPESDTLNNDNLSKTKGDHGVSSEEEQENLTTGSSNRNTDATVHQSQQPVTNPAVTEPVMERETLAPSNPQTSRVDDSATSDSNSVLDYEMPNDPVITEVFATDSWVTEEGTLSATEQTNTPEEHDLRANEINFNDSLYHHPTTKDEHLALQSHKLTAANTDSSVVMTEPTFYVSGSSIDSSEEMASYSPPPDTASTGKVFSEDKDTLSSGETASFDFTESAVRTVSFSIDSDNQVPENTTPFTNLKDKTTTETNSVSEDSILLQTHASSGLFGIKTVTSVMDENTHFYKETTLSPITDSLLTSTGSEDDQNETASVWHPSFASTERTTADSETTFSPTVTVAFPLTSEAVDNVPNVDIHSSNTKQTSREDGDVAIYRDIERNSMYSDVPTDIFSDSAQPSTLLPPSNCTGQWMEGDQNNCTVKQDILTETTDTGLIDVDTTKSPYPHSEGNNHQLLTTGAATESQTADGISTYWTESLESEATDSPATREDGPLISDTGGIRESVFSDSSTENSKVDDESLHEDGSGRFPEMDVNTLAPS